MLISTFFKENANSARAEVLQNLTGEYYIEYYDAGGNRFHTEAFAGKTLTYVENAAENWTLGIKVLNG